jgi:small subunit ribosomal protein S20
MANIKSQIKRIKTNERRRERNKAVRSALKTAEKKVRTAEGDASSELRAARVLHKRTAARHKSRLARSANASG